MKNQIVITAEEYAPEQWTYGVVVNGHTVHVGKLENHHFAEPIRVYYDGTLARWVGDKVYRPTTGDQRAAASVPVEKSHTVPTFKLPQHSAAVIASIISAALMSGAKRVYAAIHKQGVNPPVD